MIFLNSNKDKEPHEIDHELEEILKQLEEIKNQSKEKGQGKKPKRKFIAFEFGGVFHQNPIINFIFSYIVNLFFVYFVIEIFKFANYTDIFYLAALVLLYTVLEEGFRSYIFVRHFHIILKSFGTIFFFGYILIFFFLDQVVFVESFHFINATLLFFFVVFFTVFRYFFGLYLRRYLR